MPAPARLGIPWGDVVKAAVAGTMLAAMLVLLHVGITGRNPLNLIQAGASGPSAAVIQEDFPDTPIMSHGGHDGQQFYAIARQPMHWHDVAPDLDRPAYRLQRPLLPWLAWALHPTGGGPGLIAALFVVGVGGMLAGAIAMGTLSASVGGSPRLGALFPLLPGTVVSLRITTADALAVGLAFVAIACLVRERNGWAAVAAVGAVLAKEPIFLVLAGYALWRRDRASVLVTGLAGTVAAGLAVVLRTTFPMEKQIVEFAPPFQSLFRALPEWAAGGDKLAMVTVLGTVALALVALRKGGLRGRFGWAIALQLVLLFILSYDAFALDLNGTRSTLPLAVCAVLALAERRRDAGAPA